MSIEEELSHERLYNLIAVFFFSTLMLFVSITSDVFLREIPFRDTISTVLLLFFVIGYYFLLITFSFYYATRFSGWIRETYSRHHLIFWIVAIAILILIIIWILITSLGWQKTIEIFGNVVVLLLIGALLKVLEMIYNKYFKNRNNEIKEKTA